MNDRIKEAVAEQKRLSKDVILHDMLPENIELVAGADVSYDQKSGLTVAVFVVLDAVTLDIIESCAHAMEVDFPYIPGLFSYRELPPLLEAFEGIQNRPDLIICDGQGIAHPRRFGIASHLGITLDIPTIGCAKSRLYGKYEEPGPLKGDYSLLTGKDKDDVIGAVLRTRNKVKPLYVSAGHKISLESSIEWVLRMTTQYRQPETTRAADHQAGELMLEIRREREEKSGEKS